MACSISSLSSNLNSSIPRFCASAISKASNFLTSSLVTIGLFRLLIFSATTLRFGSVVCFADIARPLSKRLCHPCVHSPPDLCWPDETSRQRTHLPSAIRRKSHQWGSADSDSSRTHSILRVDQKIHPLCRRWRRRPFLHPADACSQCLWLLYPHWLLPERYPRPRLVSNCRSHRRSFERERPEIRSGTAYQRLWVTLSGELPRSWRAPRLDPDGRLP